MRLFLCMLLLVPPALASDAAELLEGVRAIGVPGVPGPLVLCGEKAFPLVSAEAGKRPVALVEQPSRSRSKDSRSGRPVALMTPRAAG